MVELQELMIYLKYIEQSLTVSEWVSKCGIS